MYLIIIWTWSGACTGSVIGSLQEAGWQWAFLYLGSRYTTNRGCLSWQGEHSEVFVYIWTFETSDFEVFTQTGFRNIQHLRYTSVNGCDFPTVSCRVFFYFDLVCVNNVLVGKCVCARAVRCRWMTWFSRFLTVSSNPQPVSQPHFAAALLFANDRVPQGARSIPTKYPNLPSLLSFLFALSVNNGLQNLIKKHFLLLLSNVNIYELFKIKHLNQQTSPSVL